MGASAALTISAKGDLNIRGRAVMISSPAAVLRVNGTAWRVPKTIKIFLEEKAACRRRRENRFRREFTNGKRRR